MNRGNINPRPEQAPGLYGFPQVTQAGLSNTPSQVTPWGLLVVIGVPQSPIVAQV